MGELGSWGAKCQSSLAPPWVGGAGLRREVIHCESQLSLSLSVCVFFSFVFSGDDGTSVKKDLSLLLNLGQPFPLLD